MAKVGEVGQVGRSVGQVGEVGQVGRSVGQVWLPFTHTCTFV